MSRRPNSECQIMVFRPTMEEFSDFSRYIQYMESQGAHRGGVAKIIPPKEWSPCKSYDNIDNLIIPAPISQLVTGQKGLFTQYNILQKPMTVKEMRRLTNTDRYSPPFHENYEDLERTYWKNITFNPVIYGADISGSLYDKDVDVWNVARLDTILDLVENDTGVKIEGVNTAYLYFGMWKTSFAWHTEDMDLYSINYVHFGAPKTWYSVPPEHGKRLERLASGFFPNSNSTCPSFLRHKMTLISPSVLRKYGIPFNKITQEAGEFMITFPYGYHSGFNHGFNCAESTNFASERWINYGLAAEKCRCRKDMVYINMDIFIKTFQPDNYERWKMNKLEVKLSYVDIPTVPDFSKPPVHWRTRMKEIREGSGVTTQTPEKKVGSPTIIKRSPPFQRKEIIKKAFGNQKSPLIKIEKTPALSAVRFKEASPVKKSCKRSLSTSEVEGVDSSTPGTSGSLLTSTDVKPFQISMGTILPADALSEQLKNIIPEPCDYLPTLMDRVKMGRRKTHPDTTAFGDTSNRTLYNFTAALPPYSDHNMYTKPEPKMVAATATSYPPLPVRLQLPVHWTTLPKSDKSQSSVTTNTQAGNTDSQLVENVTSSESDVSGDQVTKLATVPESSKSSSNSVKVAKRPPLKRRHLVSKKGPSKKSSPTVLLKSAGADSSSEEESKSDKFDSKKSKGPSKTRPETEGYPSLWPRQKSSMKIERQYNATVAKLPPYCAVCTLFQPYYQKSFSSPDEPPPALDDLLQKSQPQPLGTKTKPLIPETIFATTNDDPAPLATCELLDEEGKSLLIQCKACKVQVHASCYGIAKPTDPWTCDRCSFKAWIAQCSLCCMRGGALKPVNDGKHWAHILCAVAITEVFFDDIPRRDGINIKKISNTRQKLKCTYCRRSKQGGSQLLGTCIQCCSGSCAISFHSTCAHAAGVKMEPGDWPLPVFVYCHRHALLKEKAMEQKSEKSFPDVAVGQKVYGKHKNGRFYPCVIQHETSQNFHHVIFTDKSWSDNLFEQDIISHDFTVSAPKKGDVVSVKWIDGKTYEAEYVECKKHQVLTVEFEDGSSLNVKRQDVYTDMDEMPKRIRRKLSNATLQSRSDHFESPKKDVTEQSFVGQRAAINAQKKRKLHFTEEETSIKPSDAVVKNLESN